MAVTSGVNNPGQVDPAILEQHFKVIRESGFDPEAYAKRMELESIPLARAIRDNLDQVTGQAATDAREQYLNRLAGLEDRTDDHVANGTDPSSAARRGNPEVDRTGITSDRPADHNPDPVDRPVNWVSDGVAAGEDGADKTPRITADGSGDVGQDDDSDSPVKRGPGRPRKDAV